MAKKLAKKFTDLAAATMNSMLPVPEAKGLTLEHTKIILAYMEEAACEAARIAYRDCAAVAKLAQDQAFTARNETSATSREYAGLDAAVGAFAGMAFTYLKFEGVFCDGEDYKKQDIPMDMDHLISPRDGPPIPTKEYHLKDPRKKDSS